MPTRYKADPWVLARSDNSEVHFEDEFYADDKGWFGLSEVPVALRSGVVPLVDRTYALGSTRHTVLWHLHQGATIMLRGSRAVKSRHTGRTLFTLTPCMQHAAAQAAPQTQYRAARVPPSQRWPHKTYTVYVLCGQRRDRFH